jgi:hypothetical protein
MKRIGLIVNPDKAFVATKNPEYDYSVGKAKGNPYAGISFEE